jgi:hypothetical protein
MDSWTNDDELKNNSKFLKFEQGLNKVIFASDGNKVRNADGKVVVEFKMADGKILTVKPSLMLDIIAAALKKHSTLVSHTLYVTRIGTDQADTRYSDIKVE